MKKSNSQKKNKSRARRIESIPASNVRSVTKVPGPGDRHLITQFTRWIDGGAVYPQASSVGSAYAWKLSLIPGYTEIRAMFDFYRITKVDVLYMPASRAGSTSATTSNPATVIAAGPNYDDNAATNYATMLEREDTQIYSVFEPWEISLEPRAAMVTYGSVTNGYSLAPKGIWLDTASDVSYYGMNYAFPATAAAQQFGGSILYRLHIECAKVL